MKRPQTKPRAKPSGPGGGSRAVPAPPPPGVPVWWSAAIGLAVFVVYLLQTPPVSGDKDSAEFTLVLAFNGVAHPTGYPIYVLLGHLWVQLVHLFGVTWDYAANSWSGLGGAVALFFLHRLGLALLPPAAPWGRGMRLLLAALPVGLLAFNPIWTYETTLAEVYSWHVAWVLAISLYFVRLVRALARESDWPGRRLNAHAAAWGLLCGLGGAHHATAVFVAVPLSIALLLVLAVRRRLRPELVGTVLLAALVPLASYGIIYWRALHPARVQWPVLTPGLAGLLFHITGRQFAHNFGYFAPSLEQGQFLRWYVWPFLFPGLVLWLVGALRARGLADRAVAWALVASILAGTAYAFSYGVVDPSSYFLYPLAVGLVAAAPLCATFLAGKPGGRRATLAITVLLALTATGLSVPWSQTNSRRARLLEDFDRYVHAMWESIPLDSAFVFWPNDMYYKLQVWQLLDHEKPGLFVYHPVMLCNAVPRERFRERHGFYPADSLRLAVHLPITPGSPDSLTMQLVALLENQVNERTPLPVIHFDPERASVRLLRKPQTGQPEVAAAESLASRHR